MNFRTIAFLNKNRCFPPAQTNNCICTLRRSALYRPVLTLLQGQGNTPLITTTQIYHFFSIIKGSNAKKIEPNSENVGRRPAHTYWRTLAILPLRDHNSRLSLPMWQHPPKIFVQKTSNSFFRKNILFLCRKTQPDFDLWLKTWDIVILNFSK